MHRFRAVPLVMVISGMLFAVPTLGQDKGTERDKTGNRKIQSLTEQLKKDEKLRLTLDRVLQYLLTRNLDVNKALLDYRGAESELRRYRAMYDTNLYGKGGYSVTENSPDNPSTVFSGREVTRKNYELGVSRYFNTGTSISLSYNGLYQNINGAEISTGMGPSIQLGGEGYQSTFMLKVSQEILKNSLGERDRLNERMLENSAEINKQTVKQYLSNLLVEALVGYWNVAVAEEALNTSRISMESTARIRNLIAQKLTLGLAEREDLLDWNSRVLQSKNQFEVSKKHLYDARLAVLRTLDLEQKTDFEIGPAFTTTPPDVSYETAIKDAFIKRVDLKNQKTLVKNAELEYSIASHNLLPSVKVSLGAGTVDYSPDSYRQTFNDVNRQYSVELQANFPLENTEAKARMGDARLNYMKKHVALRKLEKEIRDEVDSRVNECRTYFAVYTQTRDAREYGMNYYNQVLRKFGQGRYSALQVKLALDDYIQLRLKELQSLLDYNVALLKRDLSRNVIFENYGIDVDGILKKYR